MSSAVKQRPVCRHCGAPVKVLRCSSCNRLNLLRFFLPGWLSRW